MRLLLALFALVMLGVGCGGDRKPDQGPVEAAGETVDEAAEDVKEGARDAKEEIREESNEHGVDVDEPGTESEPAPAPPTNP